MVVRHGADPFRPAWWSIAAMAVPCARPCCRGVLGERVGQRREVRELRGYPAVDPLLHRRYVDVLDAVRRDPAILAELNVRWVLQGRTLAAAIAPRRTPAR